MLKHKIKSLAENYFDEVTIIRQHLHKFPELSHHETETTKFIQKKLKDYHIPYKTGFAKNGIVAKLVGKNPSKKVIALRADMDALPINETNEFSFRSVNDGVMHACGHDAHTASLLGTAKILNELQDDLKGTVLFIFQPAEERFPGGANIMIQEGALDDPKPDIVIGQHVLPDMPTGEVGFKDGIYMASGDEVHITIEGQGGHAALPHNYADVVFIGSQIIVNLQQIVSRFVPATIPTVLSFGKFIANGSTNVIPNKVEISGTLRTMNEEWRAKIKNKIREIAQNTAQQLEGDCSIIIHDGYPVVYNNPHLTKSMSDYACEFLGSQYVKNIDPRMTAEDFGYFSHKYPSCYYRFGVEQPNVPTGGLHTSNFNLNDESLKTSMGLMAWLTYSYLENSSNYSLISDK